MGEELAGKWLSTGVPSWLYRWLMPAGWVGAMAALIASDSGEGALCSAADPSICGPDPAFSLAAVACLACLVAWWRMPRFAAVAGLAYLVLELRYDEEASGRTAWVIYGAACLVVLIALTWSNWRRRNLLAAVPRVPVAIPPARPLGPTLVWLGIGALAIAGLVALGLMQVQVNREDEHLSRAVQQTAVVEVVEEDEDIVLKLPDGRRHTTLPIDDYAKGAEVPVLVDPADSSWLRLQAEPADFTYWYIATGAAWLLALLLLWRDLVRRRARPRRGWTAGGLPVWIEPDGAMGFSILAEEDSDRVLGFIALDLDDDDADGRLAAAYDVLDDSEEDDAPPPTAARREWSGVLGRYRGKALLVGELADGSWPTVVFGDQVLRPATPFRSPRRSPWGVEEPGMRLSDLELDDDPDADSEAVHAEPVAVLHDLPWQIPQSAPYWWDLAERFQRMMVTATGLQIRRGIFTETVDWRDVVSVELDEGEVTLNTADGWHVIGRIPEDRLLEVAGVIETLRRQMLS